MKMLKALVSYFESNRKITASELQIQARSINALQERLSALETQIRGLGLDSTQVKQLKDQVEALSRRLIGFSKTGIS